MITRRLVPAALAALLAPLPALAQQSLFNVPATENTVPAALFGQLQLSLVPSGGESNATVDVGLFPWLEAGVNLLHMPLYDNGGAPTAHQTATSALVANASLLLRPARFVALQAGLQAGIGGHPVSHRTEPVVFGWLSLRFEADPRYGAWIVGAYTGTRGALGDGTPAGAMAGFDIPIFAERLHLVADWLIGDTAVSTAVAGLALFAAPWFQLSVGVEIPTPGSGNEYGAVVELTYLPRHDHLVASAAPPPHAPAHFSAAHLQAFRGDRAR
ncbi:MAG: hypothetical protein JWM10_5032 [Myxococcaceae bacterium]|nr:hypothetical protein [Myxococcaceae bacterium]